MKKIAVFIVAFMMILSIMTTGCTKATSQPAEPDAVATEAPQDEPAQEPADTAAPAAAASDDLQMVDTSMYKKDGKFTIGVSFEGQTNDWSSSLLYHIQYSFDVKYKDLIENVIYASADGDANKQINTVEDLLTKDIDLLMLQPLSESTCVSLIDKAMAAGIPVIIFGSSVVSDNYVAYVDRDNYGIGYNITNWVCSQIGGSGKIVQVLGEPGNGFSENVLRGSTDALAENPGVELVGTVYAEYSPAVAKQQIETILASDPDIAGVVVDGGMMGLGVLEAFIDNGLEPPVMAVDDWNGFLNYAQSVGYTNFVSVPGGSQNSADACDIAIKILNGEPVAKTNLIAPTLYTADELRAIIPEGMPDSYWALCKIPAEYVKDYFKG